MFWIMFPDTMARLKIKKALGLPWWASGRRILEALRARIGEEQFNSIMKIHVMKKIVTR